MTKNESPFDLSGRVAIVTGGNGGIGRSIALGLARAGAAVAVLARNEEKNGRVLKELSAVGVPSLALRLDVTKRSTLEQAMVDVERALGSIDILVNNAGVAMISGGVLNESADSWDTTIETHLNATFLLSKLAAASMVKRRRGKIINLAGMYSIFGAGRASLNNNCHPVRHHLTFRKADTARRRCQRSPLGSYGARRRPAMQENLLRASGTVPM